MENYIIRIYRRDNEQSIIAGIVEIVSTQEEKPFHTYEELLTILNKAEPETNIIWET